MNFIDKVPQVLSKCLSKLINEIFSNTAHRICFSLFYILFIFFKYETIVRSSTWSFGHSDPNASSVRKDVFTYFLFSQYHLCQKLGFNRKHNLESYWRVTLTNHVFFVTKCVLRYCQKKIFGYVSRETFEI